MKPRYRLKIHDRYQLELKFDHPISRERAKEMVRLEAYLFLPPNLGVNRQTYSRDHFFQDLQTFTRYGTPEISLEHLLDAANDKSPLVRVERLKAELGKGEGPAERRAAERVDYELRILACIFRANSRDVYNQVAELLAAAKAAAKDLDDALFLADKFLQQADLLIGRVRKLQREFLGPHSPKTVVMGFELADEALSVQVEDVCGKLHRVLRRRRAPAAAAMMERLAERMRAEEEYRRQAGYPTLVETSESQAAQRRNEYCLYRIGVLKKFAQSTLYLSVHSEEGSRPIVLSLNALAAMAAMLFYLAAVLLLVGNPQSVSLTAILLFVVAYAFKDRIKEDLKRYFSARMTGWLRDRENQLIDRGPEKLTVGRTAEAFSFVDPSKLEPEVRSCRARDELDELAEEGAPEQVVKYQKDITVYADKVYKVHQRVSHLNEILRLSVRTFLLHMDEPQKTLVTFEPADAHDEPPEGSAPEARRVPAEDVSLLNRVRVSKVYHINLVLRLQMKGADGKWEGHFEKFRLVLSRNGIERVETNGTGEHHLGATTLRETTVGVI